MPKRKRKETPAPQERPPRVLRLLEHALIELEKRQLPVDVELRDKQIGIVHGGRVCGVYRDSSIRGRAQNAAARLGAVRGLSALRARSGRFRPTLWVRARR